MARRTKTPVQTLGGSLAAEEAFEASQAEAAIERIATAKRVIDSSTLAHGEATTKANALAEAQAILAEAGVI